jgi:hypothetical protein
MNSLEDGPRRDKLTGDWWIFHSKDLHYLYQSPNFVRVVKSRGMKWAEHAVNVKERKGFGQET